MQVKLLFAAFFLLALSCDSDTETKIDQAKLVGLWNLETVYLNGVNSDEQTDILNGNNFLELKPNLTFERAYDPGFWSINGKILKLDRGEGTRVDWTYRVISQDNHNLVLEMKLREGDYCCNFDHFESDEVITIREVYKRQR
jgi:hypothetical protein